MIYRGVTVDRNATISGYLFKNFDKIDRVMCYDYPFLINSLLRRVEMIAKNP